MTWQPIETAPETGPILVVNMNAQKPETMFAGVRSDREGWWRTVGNWTVEPTHWMPLPDPPA